MNAQSIASRSAIDLPVVAVTFPRSAAVNAPVAYAPPRTARQAAIAQLYRESFASLLRAALRFVDDRDEAKDIVQEAFALLLSSSRRQPTRASAWCLVRELASERRAERSLREEYQEDDDGAVEDAAAAWLEGVLGG